MWCTCAMDGQMLGPRRLGQTEGERDIVKREREGEREREREGKRHRESAKEILYSREER